MSANTRTSALTAVLAAVSAVALTGCGLGAGSAPSAVKLTVTENFGARPVHVWNDPKVRGQETVMSLLTRNARVATRYGGGFVQSIDGLAGGEESGEPVDWFYYVNGVEASKGAAANDVNPGDHIWWDRHDWSETEDVPAVVGSFPEPFLNGIEGKRYPVRVECATVNGQACRIVSKRLQALGVPAALAAIGSGGEPETLRVIVGPWANIEGEPATQSIERGPQASGVYARFSANGRALTLLDQNGHSVRALSAGAGLIAATREGQNAPVWVVTGTDLSGLDRAAQRFDQAALQDHFALALSASGAMPVPILSP